MLENLTLVMPTYNRQAFAIRNMKYWSDTPVRIIVLDGSEKSIPGSELAEIGVNVSYHHAPISFIKRLAMALPLIETRYVSLYGDDEFFLADGLEACIRFLEEQADYVACCGHAIGFRPENGSIRGFGRYPRLEGRNIDHADGSERVVRHMENYVCSQVYSVVRAQPWIEAVKCYTDLEFNVLAIGELQMELCLSFAGKSRTLPHATWLRSNGETKPIRNTDPSLDEGRRFETWWHQPDAKEEKDNFIRQTAKSLEVLDSDRRTEAEYQKIIAVGGDAYVEERSQIRSSFWYKAGQCLPAPIRSSMFRAYKSAKDLVKPRYSLSEYGEKLRDRGIAVDMPRLLEVEAILMKFHGFPQRDQQ